MGYFDWAADFAKGLGDTLAPAAEVAKEASWLDTLGGVGNIIGAVGAVSPLFGGGNDDAGTGKIATRPMEENIDDIEKLRAYLAGKRRTIQAPTRRLTAAEMADDTFVPKAVMALQSALNEKRAAQPQQQTPATPQEASGANSAVKGVNPLLGQVMDRVRMAAGNPERDVTPRAKQYQQILNQLGILKGMEGYKNEYTGTTFNLDNYLKNLNAQMDYESIYGDIPESVINRDYPEWAKARGGVNTERWNALKRPPERDLVGPLIFALASGGMGAAAGLPMLGGISGTKLLSGAQSIARGLAGK